MEQNKQNSLNSEQTEKSVHIQQDGKVIGKNNFYKEFIEGKPEDVAIWRYRPSKNLIDYNLEEKSEAIAASIASKFIDWIKSLGGEHSDLDVETVVKMFEIGFHKEAATSLQVKTKEMPSVTKDVAKIYEVPHLSKEGFLNSQLLKDFKIAKSARKTLAFSASLPPSERQIPIKVQEVQKWFKCRGNKDLASMSPVWKDITHLKSTRAYCDFLMKNPQYPQPKFLLKEGMLNSNFYKPEESTEIKPDEFSNQSIEIRSLSDLQQ